MTPKVLVVDDNKDMLEVLGEMMLSLNYKYELAKSGKEALQKLRTSQFHILLTDMIMPEMDGNELIEEVIKENSEIICIVVSGIADTNLIISSLSSHKAFDFLIKPIEIGFLKSKLEKAYEIYKLRNKLKTISENEEIHFKELLQVFEWKKELQKTKIDSIAAKTIRQVNIGLFHGGGFGGLLSSLSLLVSKANVNPDTKKVEISEKAFQLMKENYTSAKNLVNGFVKAQTILMNDVLVKDQIEIFELAKFFETCKTKIKPMLNMKYQKLVVSSIPKSILNAKIIFNRELMESAILELLINAMKYSNNIETIYLIVFVKEKILEIKIINPAHHNQDGTIGISEEHQDKVFEPFYRISTVSHEGYFLEEFGAGIGLSVVKKIIELHKGEFRIFTIKNNNVQNKSEYDVSVSIRFPLLEIEN
ncbi:MAG: response regulator [Leptospiraceae bacterium]|nr:response regulator [Leptospiraceae bacterium]MCK6382038.1 response regulator [Leptospiraceae bacterium]NUM40803.1 response regulator [Leptospiraceae bacterium]